MSGVLFQNNDLVEVETSSVRALARIRQASDGGRLHIAFENGEYFPWVDTDVLIRHFGNDPQHSSVARILHAGATTALLQLVAPAAAAPSSSAPRAAFDTLPGGEGELDW